MAAIEPLILRMCSLRRSLATSENVIAHHAQANPLTVRIDLENGETWGTVTHIIVELHADRRNHTVLANLVLANPGADLSTVEGTFTGAQMNQVLTSDEDSKDFWLVAYTLGPPRSPDPAAEMLHMGAGILRLWADAAAMTTAVAPTPTPIAALASDLDALEDRVAVLEAGGGGGGGGGSTNITITPSPTGVLVASSSGTDGTIPAADVTNAGVFLPAEKTKLAGIQANATDDQTPSEILTAIKTVDGAASGLDSDLLDGEHGAHYLDRSHHTGTQAQSTIVDLVADLADKADLDINGKVPSAQLPESIVGALSYQGTWNASTNTPTLADGTGTKGLYYVVATGGTRDLGSGSIEFAAGDWAVHNGTIWSKLDATDQVTSVAGKTGVVTLNCDDITGLSGTVTDDLNAAFTAIDDLTNDVAARLVSVNNLSDLPAPSIARTNLGLGTAATANTGTSAGNVVVLDGSAKLPAIDGSQLTNLPGAATVHCAVVETDFALSTASGVQAALPSSRDVFTLAVSTWYEFEFCYMITRSTNSVTTALAFEIGGGGSVSPFAYNVHGRTGAAANATGSGVEGFVTTEASTVVLATASTGGVIRGKGFFKTGASGTPTFTPKINWSGTAAGSPTMLAGSYVKVTPAAATSGNVA